MSQTSTVEGRGAGATGHDRYEMVVGLEVHVELATATKLFSASPNRFGDEPNTNIDPVTLGLPVGVQLLAPTLDEPLMFRAALVLEEAMA